MVLVSLEGSLECIDKKIRNKCFIDKKKDENDPINNI